ncbi:MAG: hypothetical protein R6V50_07875 [Thermoplasmatota archaeon]
MKIIKKLYALSLISIIILSVISTMAIGNSTQQKNSALSRALGSSYDDELDQSMTDYEGSIPLGNTDIFGFPANLSIAQSFIPQMELLTRIKLFMARSQTASSPCFLAVREDLYGENLAVISAQASQFPVVEDEPTEDDLEWIEFNFDDIWVAIGETYYLVLYTANITNNFYWVGGNGTNVYPNGSAYFSIDDGQTWEEFIEDADGCFQTYGLRETFLNVNVEGNIFGPSFMIKNIGEYTAWEVAFMLTVTGGIMGGVNYENSGTILSIPSNSETEIQMPLGSIIGIGPIEMTLHISAANVRDEISIQRNGFIIVFFLFLF